MHVPQSLEAQVELEDIAAIPNHIITPRHAKPLIGVYQDTLVGSYRLTRPNVSLTKREYMNLMMWNKRFDGEMPAPRAALNRYTGQQVLSALLPSVNIEMGNKAYDGEKDSKESQNYVKIQQGDIKQGIIDDDIYMKPGKGIIHTTYNDYGPKETTELLDALQNTVESFLVMNGFSVGISDLVADEDTKRNIDEVIQTQKKQVENLLLQVHTDLFENNTGKTNQQEFEDQVFGILNQATDNAGKAGKKSLSTENRLLAMVNSGSKGNTTNVAQMIACLGQQAIEGKRIQYGLTDRTMPHYKKYDDGAEARGFIESSFIRGLTPQEFYMHAMSGREGLIDTAVKTAETGYIQRQLIKAMEDLVVQHDGTVRDANMNIIQFQYGEDGVMATKVEGQSIPLGKMRQDDIRREFGLEGVDWSAVLQDGTSRDADAEAIATYVSNVLDDQRMLVEGVFGGSALDSGSVSAPVNLARMILNTKVRFGLQPTGKTDLIPGYVLDGIGKIIGRTNPNHRIWAALLRFHLAPHKLIVKERFTKNAFDALCELIVVNHMKAWVQPGEQVGVVAAQSIGEPSTQMTLNSVDWNTEIIIAKNGKIMTPKIGEFIDNYYNECDKSKVQHLANDQIYISLEDGNDWKAISCDENGKMMWTKLEAITRHPVINEDGTNTIIEVELQSGRKVKATKGHSFLTLVDGKVKDVKGSELRVGGVLPLTMDMALDGLEIVDSLSLRDILEPSEWLYESEAKKAIDAMNSGVRTWFHNGQGVDFTIPYARSDAFRDAFANGHNTSVASMRSNCIYPKHGHLCKAHIPETITLDKDFGFFAGAYLAEGMSNTTQVNITNNDEIYLEKAKVILDKWNVGYHIVKADKHCTKTDIKGTTTSLIAHSTVLAKVMSTLFGRVSYEKTLPEWVFQASDEFVQGLVDGYVSGDGTVSKKSTIVAMTSVSESLLVRFGTLLSRYGIHSMMTSHMPEKGVFDSVAQNYTLTISSAYAKKFAETFSLSVSYKQDALNKFAERRANNKYNTTGQVFWDNIVAITECEPLYNRVYDLTVEHTKNFVALNTIALRDTFHLAGVASKSNVTRGVPRLKELLKVSKNPKATSLTIYLKPEYRNSKDKAREVVQDLELTLLRSITDKIAIYWDPNDESSVIEEDRQLLEFYRMYEE